MGAWVAMTTNSTFSLINGGLAGTIWVYLGSWLFTVTLVCSLVEMASMAPTSGGKSAPYRLCSGTIADFRLQDDTVSSVSLHLCALLTRTQDWVSEFAPPLQQKFLSYCVGW